MSVLITAKIKGDVAVFRTALAERAGEFEKVAERGREAGAIHHRFGVGDGYVLVIDEWGSAEQFEKFFGDPELQAFVGSAGGDVSVPPEITVAQAISSPDQF
jgi:hypothetical protein